MFHLDHSTSVFTQIVLCLVFFSSGLSLLISIEQLNRVKRFTLNYGMSAIFFCSAVVLANIGMIISGVCLQYPFSIFPVLTAICIMGPLQIYHNFGLFKSVDSLSVKEKLHFLPAGIVFLSEIFFHLQPLAFKRRFLQQTFAVNGSFWGKAIILVCTLYLLGHMCYLVWREIEIVRDNKDLAQKVSMMIRVHIILILSIVCLGAGAFSGYGFLLNAGAVLASLITISVFLFYSKAPELFQHVITESRKKRYQRSLLKGVNEDVVKSRIMELMEQEQIYTDMELRLEIMANELSITPHQLSQFLNDNLNTDFRGFVNTYRVNEAKRQLVDNPDKKIIDIGFDVGFSSKSTFNTVFKKQTDMTPSEFRLQKK